ncbi:MAG TPA: hypothetical protein VGI88_13775, partial [Verrucomicrobiae bacterium]
WRIDRNECFSFMGRGYALHENLQQKAGMMLTGRFVVALPSTGDWKVPRTRRQECLRYTSRDFVSGKSDEHHPGPLPHFMAERETKARVQS